MNKDEIFGPASDCQGLSELALLQRRVMGDDAQRAIAAYAMVLSGRSAPQGDYFKDAIAVLDCLGTAKMELDKSSLHTEPTVMVTATILSEAQRFVNEMTIPCTEWPTSGEVVSLIFEIAAKFACAGPWKRRVVGLHGEVIGVEEFDRI